MKTRAAVITDMEKPRPYATSRPLAVEELDLAPPGHGEILVKIRAAGLCHSDLSTINGDRPRQMPMVLGHEAAVEAAKAAHIHAFIEKLPKGYATTVGELPSTEEPIRLSAGDTLRLTRDCSPAPYDDPRRPHIGCTLPELFDVAETGDRVLFDDGKLGGRVTATGTDHLDVRIEHPSSGEASLRGGKGINVPGRDLPIPALTPQDLADLPAVVKIADIIELAFVREPDDVTRLFEELDRLDAPDLAVVLKIETPKAFEHLPRLILTAMRRRRVGVMIARGDLAVESGYERMAELQQETLRLCEAAHLPVVWATQVLEQLAKTGRPSRAEITDAAMSERAECVMLNKGPFIVDAVIAMDRILGRTAGREYKDTALLPGLTSWPIAPDGSFCAPADLAELQRT